MKATLLASSVPSKADILSIYTQRLLSERHIAGVGSAMRFLFNQTYDSIDCLVAAPAARIGLARRYPGLLSIAPEDYADLDAALINVDPESRKGIIAAWVDRMAHKASLDITDIAPFSRDELRAVEAEQRQSAIKWGNALGSKMVDIKTR
jgi:hypothetical protein